MKFKPKMMEKVEHVTVAHAGASYNPDFDDHQALLRQEHNKEFKKVKSQDSYKAKAKPKSKSCQINLQIFKNFFRCCNGGRDGDRVDARSWNSS
jgi:hypothetical protein